MTLRILPGVSARYTTIAFRWGLAIGSVNFAFDENLICKRNFSDGKRYFSRFITETITTASTGLIKGTAYGALYPISMTLISIRCISAIVKGNVSGLIPIVSELSNPTGYNYLRGLPNYSD